jgi:hypothetical protein
MSTSWDNVNTGQNLPVIKEVHGSPYKLSENLECLSFVLHEDCLSGYGAWRFPKILLKDNSETLQEQQKQTQTKH